MFRDLWWSGTSLERVQRVPWNREILRFYVYKRTHENRSLVAPVDLGGFKVCQEKK